ncbi:MAG: glycosyltransferase family 4 protein [Halobacteriota archaeon]
MKASIDDRKTCHSVLHLIDIFDARYERDQQRIVALQSESEYSVTVVTSKYNDEWRRSPRSAFREWEAGLKGVDVRHSRSVKLPFFETAVYFPRPRALCNYDIIHAYGPWAYSSYLACILKEFTSTPVVMRADFSEPGYQRAKRSLFWRALLHAQFRYADAITTFTQTEKQYLTDLGIAERKIWVIPVGVDLAKFGNTVNSARPENEPVIGYIGRFAPLKGVHRLVAPLSQILHEYENVKVIFAGPQYDRAYFARILKEMSQFVNFTYMGTPQDSTTFFDQCDIILIPGMRDTGAITAKEAMAAGKAVVAFNVYPFNSYIENEISGLLIDAENDIYESCKRLIEDSRFRARIQKAALIQAREFGDREMVRKIETMYDSIVALKQSGEHQRRLSQ